MLYLLRVFSRDIKASPIDQEVSLPSTDAPASVYHCAAEVPVFPRRPPEFIVGDREIRCRPDPTDGRSE